MIYDPRRRALELRQRILESMTADELEEYARGEVVEGQLAYHNLAGWWLATFSPEEREHIEQVFRPFGIGGGIDRPLTRGKILSAGGTSAKLLSGLLGWFRKTELDRHIAKQTCPTCPNLS